MTTLEPPRGQAAPDRPIHRGSQVERWYGRFDAVVFVGMLNLLVVAFKEA